MHLLNQKLQNSMAKVNVENVRNKLKQAGLDDAAISSELEKRGLNPQAKVQDVAQKGDVNFFQRLRLGFGDEGARRQSEQMERQAGLKDKFDVGDIADIAGGALPFIGGGIGALGGTVLGTPVGGAAGGAIGTTAGESVRRAVGQALGVRGSKGPFDELTGTAVGGGLALAGGKALPLAGKAAGLTGKAVGSATKPVSKAVLGGRNTQAIGQSFRRPKDVSDFSKGRASLQTVSDRIDEGIEAVKKNSRQELEEIVNKLPGKKIPKQQTVSSLRSDITESLGIGGSSLTKNNLVNQAGLTEDEARVVIRLMNRVKNHKDFTDKGIINLRRSLDRASFYKPGNENFKASNQIVARLRRQLNEIAAESTEDRQLSQALRRASEDMRLIDQMEFAFQGANAGRNVESAATRLSTIINQLDDPLRREETRRLLRELGQRTGVDFEDILQSASASRTLSADMAGIGDPFRFLFGQLPTKAAGATAQGLGRATGQQGRSQLFNTISPGTSQIPMRAATQSKNNQARQVGRGLLQAEINRRVSE